MAVVKSKLLLELEDGISPAARRIDQNLANLQQQSRRSQEMFNQHRAAFVGTALAAYALARTLAAPIQASVEFSTKLEDIRQKADLSADAIRGIGRASRDIGLATGQGPSKIADVIDTLVGFGAVNPDEAVELATPIGKASTAYRADPADLATATNAMIQNLGVSVSDATYGLDILAQSGKDGGFEMRDMAAEMPGVSAAARAIGMQGTDALASVSSWLQVSRTNTANGSEAATNFMNFMQKVQAEQATKAFKAVDVDIGAEIKRAIAEGQDPIEHVLGILQKKTGGDQQKIQSFFSDAQVLKFIAAALPNIEKYNELNTSALGAQGTMQRDFIARSDTPEAIQARFYASMENLNIAIGNSLVPALADFARSVTPMIDGVASFVDANGELVAAVVEITAALIGLRLLSSAGGMASALMGMGVGGNGNKPGNAKNGGLGGGAGKGPNLGGLGFMGFNALGIGLDYKAFGDAVTEDGGKAWMDARNARDAAINDALLSFDIGGFKPFAAMQTAQNAMNNPQGGIAGINTGPTQGQIDALKGQIAQLDAEIAVWPEEGMEARRAGLASKLAQMQTDFATSSGALTSSMQTIMERLRVIAASGVTIPTRVAGPGLPASAQRMIDGARAGGGPVRAGGTYLVGEHGPELATFGHNAMIHKAGSFSPPGMPAFGSKGGSAGDSPITFKFGDINLQNPTNANPHEMARALGDIVSDRLRASHSNGSM